MKYDTLILLIFVLFLGLACLEELREAKNEIIAASATIQDSTKALVGKADTLVSHVDKAVEQAPAVLDKAVKDVVAPLPTVPPFPTVKVPTLFHLPTPTPTPHP